MTSTTPQPASRPGVPLAVIAGLGLRVAAVSGRLVTICLLTPIVLLCGVAAFVSLAVVGTARLAQSIAASSISDMRAAHVPFYANTPERVESVAVRQAA
jgi:hypothetical protein